MKTLHPPDAAALHAAVAQARFVRRGKQHRRNHEDQPLPLRPALVLLSHRGQYIDRLHAFLLDKRRLRLSHVERSPDHANHFPTYVQGQRCTYLQPGCRVRSGRHDPLAADHVPQREEPRVAEPDHDVRVPDPLRPELVRELALGLYLAIKQHFTIQLAKRRKMPRVLGESVIDFLDDLVQRLDFDELRGAGHGASL